MTTVDVRNTHELAQKHLATAQSAYKRFAFRVATAFAIAFGGIYFAEGADHPTRALAWSAVAAGVRAVVGLLTPLDPAVGVKAAEFKRA